MFYGFIYVVPAYASGLVLNNREQAVSVVSAVTATVSVAMAVNLPTTRDFFLPPFFLLVFPLFFLFFRFVCYFILSLY